MTEYLVIYETAEDGGWGAYSPDLPGCIACGKTRAEVEKLMREAIPMHIEAMRETGEPVPQPSHIAGSVAA
ncbi:MAG TPA: type II toxin-antitoxin system HicB family antitoxin [Solirubrobacteraceae bacterium]|jgi:predicted RNase H-like HicB family nuclease|nr:type II toxin-antitoxin system HicB family antitoxin [Solirubrobacteraceae bacterium]